MTKGQKQIIGIIVPLVAFFVSYLVPKYSYASFILAGYSFGAGISLISCLTNRTINNYELSFDIDLSDCFIVIILILLLTVSGEFKKPGDLLIYILGYFVGLCWVLFFLNNDNNNERRKKGDPSLLERMKRLLQRMKPTPARVRSR